MAQEIVEAVRKAEIQGELIVKAAIDESEAIKKQSQKDVELTIAAKTKEAKDKADDALAEAKIVGNNWLKKAQLSAEKESVELRVEAKLKEQEAIELIVSELN